jgi:hypothetical protein
MGSEQCFPEHRERPLSPLLDLHKLHELFAAAWDRSLRLQGFLEAFTDAAIQV